LQKIAGLGWMGFIHAENVLDEVVEGVLVPESLNTVYYAV
jgi:hypothetical protein